MLINFCETTYLQQIFLRQEVAFEGALQNKINLLKKCQ